MKTKRSYRFLILTALFACVVLGCKSQLEPVTSPSLPEDDPADENVFFDDFSGSALDASKWLVMERNWGGQSSPGVDYNGGVLARNIELKNNRVYLHAFGNQYTGPVRGKNRDGSLRADGQRVGAVISTKDYFGSGRYEVRMKIIPKLGVVSAMWTFHYQEFYPGDPQYVNRPVGGADYYAINHEIDIELPGRPGAPFTGQSYGHALMNTWIGENTDEQVTGYTALSKNVADGKFHVYRFDWHTDDSDGGRRVDFYIDGVLQQSITGIVPDIKGRFTIGAWFPKDWAGDPDFDQEAIQVDWVKITPFEQSGDRSVEETYPDSGWGSISDIQISQ